MQSEAHTANDDSNLSNIGGGLTSEPITSRSSSPDSVAVEEAVAADVALVSDVDDFEESIKAKRSNFDFRTSVDYDDLSPNNTVREDLPIASGQVVKTKEGKKEVRKEITKNEDESSQNSQGRCKGYLFTPREFRLCAVEVLFSSVDTKRRKVDMFSETADMFAEEYNVRTCSESPFGLLH